MSDIHGYGAGYAVADFLDPFFVVPKVNWGISNSPFSTAREAPELRQCAHRLGHLPAPDLDRGQDAIP